jgi:diguanylate cyclase (GGDEF)-like protein
MARCYNFLGIWAMNRGNALIAQDYYLNGINYCRNYHLFDMEIQIGVNIGALYIQCGRYEEAQEYLEKLLVNMTDAAKDEDYHSFMVSICQNLAKCLIPQEKPTYIEEIFRNIHRDHWNMVGNFEKLTVLCTEAIYYDSVGEQAKRDHCVEQVHESVSDKVVILDAFDDYCDYAAMLLKNDKDREFWQLMEMMEPLTRSCGIIKMQLRLIALKIRFFRKHEQNAEYLQEAGLYYELSELMEKETRTLMVNVLNLRKSLDSANRARKELEKQNRILMEKSEMDPLTRLANRFRLNDYSDEIFQRVNIREGTLAVEILDVDYFKELNDNYGHQAGDSCLVGIADVLKTMATEHGAFCARYGGDEFVLIYEGVTKERTVQYAAELKEKILALNIENKYSRAKSIVTISQGLCWGKPQKDDRMWDFLHQADEMLYKVKSIARNNYCVGTMDDCDDFVIGPES